MKVSGVIFISEYTLRELQERIMRYKREKVLNTDPNKIYLELLHLIEEAGEVVRNYRRNDSEQMSQELADVLIITIGVLGIMDVNSQELVEEKIRRNEQRIFGSWEYGHQNTNLKPYLLNYTDHQKLFDYATVQGLSHEGYNLVQIAEQMFGEPITEELLYVESILKEYGM